MAQSGAQPRPGRLVSRAGGGSTRRHVLARVDLLRINDRVLDAAGLLVRAELRCLDAIHLASAEQLGSDLRGFVTNDERLALAAAAPGFRVIRPA